jgi:broad specificity phosphatase PhoE
MRLIIIRHGETNDNANGICQGQNDSPLSENGIAQAKSLALRFKDRKIDAVYSSDLQRAANTALEILKFHLI